MKAGNAAEIARLNDEMRHTFTGGTIFLTAGVSALPKAKLSLVLEQVRRFEEFDQNNDPYGEHDFGSLEVDGTKIFFKFDLYEDPDVKDDNGNPAVTRVLTIMLAEEY